MTVTIRTRYLTGDRWGSNVGGIRATAAGRQRTVRWRAELTREDNHRAAAVALAGRLPSLTFAVAWQARDLQSVADPGDILTPLTVTATDDPGLYLWPLLEPWPADDARKLADTARHLFADHGHPGYWDRLTRENCGACVLAGYGDGTDDGRAPLAPNYAGWARVYVEARRVIPAKYLDGFRGELAGAPYDGVPNYRYADALRRDVLTYGATVGGAS